MPNSGNWWVANGMPGEYGFPYSNSGINQTASVCSIKLDFSDFLCKGGSYGSLAIILNYILL
jgi:hypothetical protein